MVGPAITCVVCGKEFDDGPGVRVGFVYYDGIARCTPPCQIVEKPKRKKPFNAKRATIDLLRADGWIGDDVERRAGPYSVDFLGWADLVFLKDGVVLGVQVTTESNHASRAAKCRESKRCAEWRKHGGRAEVWSWGKVKAVRGGKAYSWALKRREEIR